MTKKRSYGLWAIALAWIVAVPIAGSIFMTSSGTAHGIRGNGAERHLVAKKEAGSIGAEREALLEEATRRYVGSHPDADPAMREGKQLAPVDFLNAELAREHAKFRVRAVHGADAEIYDVF